MSSRGGIGDDRWGRGITYSYVKKGNVPKGVSIDSYGDGQQLIHISGAGRDARNAYFVAGLRFSFLQYPTPGCQGRAGIAGNLILLNSSCITSNGTPEP